MHDRLSSTSEGLPNDLRRSTVTRWRPSTLALLLSASAFVASRPAHATYSTVAMERSSGRYGAVSASCVALSTLGHVYAAVPERGAVLTQSYLVEGDASQALALQLLGQGSAAAEVIAAMIDPRFDPDFSQRQYVVLDAFGAFAAFSGTGALPFASHRDASDAAFSAGIAGNLLTGEEVLEAAALGFADAAACDLEERLMNALVAASVDGLGDARCVAEGRPAQSIRLYVSGANGAEDLDLAVEAASGVDPTTEVLRRFAEWRDSHPCRIPAEMPDEPRTSSRDQPSSGCSTARVDGSGACWFWLLAVVFARYRARALARLRAVAIRPE